MLTYETLRILKTLLLEVGHQEQKIELIRQRLASMDNFEPYVAFQRIDRNRNEFVVAEEIIDFLRENKIYGVTFDEAQFLVKFFDSDDDIKLSYSDFLQMMVPCDNHFLRCSVTQRETYKVEKFSYLPLNIEQELANLIFSEIECFRKTEELRKDLEKRHDFSTYACFRAVDERNEGDINPDNLRLFFKANAYYPTEDEIIAIIRRLDVDADCKISYAEFCVGIKTQEFSKKVQFEGQSQQQQSRNSPTRISPSRTYQDQQPLQQTQYSPSRQLQFGNSSSSGFGKSYGVGQFEESKYKPIGTDSMPLRNSQGFSNSQFDNKAYQSPSRQSQMQSSYYGGNEKRQSPLRPQDEDELVKAFKEQIILDRDLEKAKIDLVESCFDFNLFDAFRIIDREAKGYSTVFEIKDACDSSMALDLFQQVSIEDIELFMARYDKNSDRKLRFSEFCSAFAPIDAYFNDKVSQRKSSYGAQFSEKTKLLYRNLWLIHFRTEQQAEIIRKRLSKRSTFSVYDAFKAVDADSDGKITRDEFKDIIEGRTRGFQVALQEINQLMDRYDKNGDGVISYSEFSDELRPHSPNKSKY